MEENLKMSWHRIRSQGKGGRVIGRRKGRGLGWVEV